MRMLAERKSNEHDDPRCARDGMARGGNGFVQAWKPAPPRRGFTMIEILVVVLIIGLLIALLVPALGWARDRARATSTQQRMGSIAMGLEQYKTDTVGGYPPSWPTLFPAATPPGGAEVAVKSGSVMLAEALLGYLDYQYDGAGPANPSATVEQPDPALGFRKVTGGKGRVYGPYVNTAGTNLNTTTGTSGSIKVYSPERVTFIDAYGNDILYYRAASNLTGVTKLFGTSASIFNSTDNTDSSDVVKDPTSPMAPVKFFKAMGTDSNTAGLAGASGRDSYILISGGKDGKFFTDDDVVQGGR
jgi:prepilin-type N-terminal cleavage/methylation domain-containing protein